jgi:hypothetical protein
MKNNYLLFLFLCVLLSGTAQTPFAQPEAHWCNLTYYMWGTSYNEPEMYRDTVITSIPCTHTGSGCLFISNDTVYRILADESIHFLYDYSAQKGDVWEVYLRPDERLMVAPKDSIVKVHIDSAYTSVIHGQILRLLNTSIVDTPFTNSGYSMGYVIENVGGSNSFIPGPWGAWDNGGPDVMCYSDSANGAFSVNYDGVLEPLDSCVCHVWMGQNEIPETVKFSISPNPANSSVIVLADGSKNVATAAILDLTGKQLIQAQLLNGTTQIYTETLPDGLYFVTLYSSAKVSTRKLVIQH